MDPKPPKLAVDADGYVWRVYPPDLEITEEMWSVAPQNIDNEPIPEPVTFYYPLDGIDVEALRAGTKAYRRDDHRTAALKWARTIRQVLAAIDQEPTE